MPLTYKKLEGERGEPKQDHYDAIRNVSIVIANSQRNWRVSGKLFWSARRYGGTPNAYNYAKWVRDTTLSQKQKKDGGRGRRGRDRRR